MYNSIYPVNIRPYSGPKNDRIDKDNDNKDGQHKQESNKGRQQQKRAPQNFYTPFVGDTSEGVDNFQRTTTQETYSSNSYSQPIPSATSFQTGVNIAQILIDFKNTVEAIGTPDEIADEINGYFNLIERQAHSKEPNEKLIKSNLKNASIILDKYISDSLAKPSKVVENWIDTLFLQRVDYSYDEAKINPDFQLKFPERKKEEENQHPEIEGELKEPAVNDNSAKNVERSEPKLGGDYMPKDEILRRIFVQAKKYAMINETQKALTSFQKALTRAVALNDEQTQSMIYFEAARVFDKKNLCVPALKNYLRATKKSKDYNIKTKAHYNMAKIYEDFVKEKPAVEHYFVAVSYAGETENFAAQSASLVNIAGIHAEKARKKEVYSYVDLAVDMVKETKNPKLMGGIYAKSAKNYEILGESKEALSYYKESTKQYKKTNSPQKLARNFEHAAELMKELGCFRKAINLYQKAYEEYSTINDENSMKYVFEQIAQLNELSKR